MASLAPPRHAFGIPAASRPGLAPLIPPASGLKPVLDAAIGSLRFLLRACLSMVSVLSGLKPAWTMRSTRGLATAKLNAQMSTQSQSHGRKWLRQHVEVARRCEQLRFVLVQKQLALPRLVGHTLLHLMRAFAECTVRMVAGRKSTSCSLPALASIASKRLPSISCRSSRTKLER